MKRSPRPVRAAKPTIHIIGDSHSSVFTGLHGVCGTIREHCAQAVPGFRVWHLGQYLAHSVGLKEHAVHKDIRWCMEHIDAGERVVFFFGEIDCRNHVARHARADKRIEDVAAETARAYVKRAKSLTPRRRLGFIAIPPPTVVQHGNTLLPTVGTFAQRARAVRAFNLALHAAASLVNADVIDIHDDLATSQGEPSPAYFADGVHADPRALPLFVREFSRARWLRPSSPAVHAALALSLVPPSIGGREMLPGRLDEPRAARRILIERAALICKAAAAKRIAIWGAGRHTQAMGMGVFRELGMRVVAILDDRPSPEVHSIHGVPVVLPARAPRMIDAVIASSDAHEGLIIERARAHFAGQRTVVVPIYSWQEPGTTWASRTPPDASRVASSWTD